MSAEEQSRVDRAALERDDAAIERARSGEADSRLAVDLRRLISS